MPASKTPSIERLTENCARAFISGKPTRPFLPEPQTNRQVDEFRSGPSFEESPVETSNICTPRGIVTRDRFESGRPDYPLPTV